MLLVKTKLGISKIAGIGLFADQFIPKDSVIWRFRKGFDIRVEKDYPDTLTGPALDFFKKHAYQNPVTLKWVLCADDARFFNHSKKPNTHCTEDPEDEDTMAVASRDIENGEELLINYEEFDTDPYYGFDKSCV